MLLNFHSTKITEIYPSPCLQKSRLLFCKHPVFLSRGCLRAREAVGSLGHLREAEGRSGWSQKPSLEGKRLSRQGCGRGTSQHRGLWSLLASQPRRRISPRKGISRGLPENFRHGSVAQDWRVCGKAATKTILLPGKLNTARSPDACGVIWAHREDSPDAGHLTQHCQMGFPTSKWVRCRNHSHLCSAPPKPLYSTTYD